MCEDIEIRKIQLEHKYQVRRLWLDKILLGLIIGVVVFFASMYMENFKNTLNKDRFLLESRLTALKEIRDKYSELSSDYYYLSKAKEDEKEQIRIAYKGRLDVFMATLNKWSILFSDKFARQVEFHYWSHQAPAHDKYNLKPEHTEYGSYMFDDFDNLTRIALWEETLGESPKGYGLITFEDKEDIGDFFETNYKSWKKKQQKHNKQLNKDATR